MNVHASIGHNGGPELTPFELSAQEVQDLFEEAKLWLDGEPVTTEDQASALNTLETRIRKAAKDAEARRKAEAKPFDDGKAEVQARYKPLTEKADKALESVKAAFKPYLIELDRIQQEAARKAREEADKIRAEALKAMQERDHANLEQSIAAEQLVKDAKAAEQAAIKAQNAKAHAKGEGRATGLRTVYRAEMIDAKAAAAWVWKDCNPELLEFVQDRADKAVRAGAMAIPGFKIHEEKVL